MTTADYRRDFKKGLICGRLEAVGSSQKKYQRKVEMKIGKKS